MDLASFNASDNLDNLTEHLLACCDVEAWAQEVVDGRPYASVDDLLAKAAEASARLGPEDVDKALAAHPRLGERGTRQAAWSREEQSGVRTDAEAVAEGNRRYEERFGRVFLICATGLDAGEILRELKRRLGNDDRAEAAEMRDELGKIARVRLRKVVQS